MYSLQSAFVRAGHFYRNHSICHPLLLLAAGDRLTAVLSGEPDPGPPTVEDNVQTEGTFATAEETKNSNATTWVIVLLILATIIPMATYFLLYQ